MQITPEMKAQLEAQKKQCVYCKVISKEMPGKYVFEDDQTIAFLDIYPPVKGHTVYMLKEHYPLAAYASQEELKHYFGTFPALAKAIKEGMVRTAINIYHAAGGAAGQQMPHFFFHFMPRERGDGFFNFFFDKKGKALEGEKKQALLQIFPKMMHNHFTRNPAEWHQGAGEIPPHLQVISSSDEVLYEDEQVLCVFPKKNVVPGHIDIYSKVEEKFIEKLSPEQSMHLFSTASLASTLVFENLQAQGTNILVKSGAADDNPEGRLKVMILPRWPGDDLQKIFWQPKQPSYNLDEVTKKIKDKTWKISYKKKEKEKPKVVMPEVVKIGGKKKGLSGEDEIKDAIAMVKGL